MWVGFLLLKNIYKNQILKFDIGGGAVILTSSIYAALRVIILIYPHTNQHK